MAQYRWFIAIVCLVGMLTVLAPHMPAEWFEGDHPEINRNNYTVRADGKIVPLTKLAEEEQTYTIWIAEIL